MGGGEADDPQKLKRIAAAAYDYENDARWSDYWSNVLIPPNMASRSDVVTHFKRKFYQRYIDPELIVEPMNTSSQPARTSAQPQQSSSSSSTATNDTRQRSSGTASRTSGASATPPPPNSTPLRWDKQTIQFSVNAWVFVVAVLAIFPLMPKNLSNRAYRFSLLGTACSSLYSLYSLYGKPRAWNLQALQVWFQSVVVTKDFMYSIYCLNFASSNLYIKFALIPILCRAIEHVAKFLRRNFSRSTLYRKYLEDACVWVDSNSTTINILSSQAEIGIGFILIISLISWQRNIIQTFMYWQLLKLMYHAPATAGYHQSAWAKIGRTVNPLIQRYAPFLTSPLSTVQRWWFSNYYTPMERFSSLPEDFLSRDSLNEITEEPPLPEETDHLVRVSSLPSYQQPRRRTGSKTASSLRRPCRQQSFSREIGHAAAETYLLTRLSFKLLSYLGIGYRWISKLLALALYAMFLMPGFLQVGYLYFFSSHVYRSIVYGDQPRNRLDLYLPVNRDGLKPVVVFVTGGAWIIGYKAWGSLLGIHLSQRDIIVACIDYRNFPQGTISDMVNDVSQGIAWVCNSIVEFGGDPNRIYLMGQSAGAHISACALIHQAVKESRGDDISWHLSQLNAYFGLSGGYNLHKLVDHFHSRGLYRSIFLSIMEGEKSLEQFSPEIIIQSPSSGNAASLLPHIILFHGTADYSILPDESKRFVETLQKLGAKADLILYDGKTHTDLFLQDPLRGGKDELFDYIVSFIHANDKEALAMDAMAPPRRRFVPDILLTLAGKVSPF